MEEPRTRKLVSQDYYTDSDYDNVMLKLPEIIKEASKKAGDLLEPTVQEKREVMELIKNFIRDKGRKIYGGTAINEAIKLRNPEDAIYNDYDFSDIEFYSPTPVVDLVELTNLIYEKKYKYPVGQQAQHDETYTIFVNFHLYCDITYVPLRVYNGIKTIIIDGINYVDPHFIFIDQLRILNQPLTAAEQRWEKTFKRMYVLLKSYPLEYFDKQIKIPDPPTEIKTYISKIKNDFMSIKEVQETALISGFEAYNFYIRHAMSDRTVEQQARTTYGSNRLNTYITNVPFIELVSVNYRDTVPKLFDFIKSIVADPKNVTIDEYFPLFQFIGYSVTINYNGIPLAKVYDTDGFCVPNIKTTRGYMYVSFQYLLMSMFINKFRAHLDKNKEMYFNYGIAISNLVSARNSFLNKRDLSVINSTVFGEFRINCIGTTASYSRVSKLRSMERYKQGKVPFRYNPEQFFSQSAESQAKFDPAKYIFKNTSGNKINNPKNLIFKIGSDGSIQTSDNLSEDDNTEQQRVTNEIFESETTETNQKNSLDNNMDNQLNEQVESKQQVESNEQGEIDQLEELDPLNQLDDLNELDNLDNLDNLDDQSDTPSDDPADDDDDSDQIEIISQTNDDEND